MHTKAYLGYVKEVKPEKMVLAHMGGMKFWDDVEAYLVGENVYLDTAYVIDEMVEEQFLRIVKNHGVDKILFASDSPWKPQKEFVIKMKELCGKMGSLEAEEWIMSRNGLNILS